MNAMLMKTEFDAWTGRLVRRLRRPRNTQCIHVLTYHSIAREDSVFTRGTTLRLDPAAFERHVDYLAEHYTPIRLSELLAALARGDRLHQAVVMTFDDGFADTMRRAYPVLYRRRIPMTVFPVTSVIGNTDLLWQHKLAWLEAEGYERKVLEAMQAEGFPSRTDDEPLADYARRNYRADLPEILEGVLRSTGHRGARLAAALRPYVEAEDLAEADPEFVEFGNHTHTHAILSALTPEQQRKEMTTARETLTALTGVTPIALAYPFGLKSHYNADSRRLACETGHRAALDMRRRINAGPVDPFELSRKPASCGTPLEFEKMMEDWPENAAAGVPGGGG